MKSNFQFNLFWFSHFRKESLAHERRGMLIKKKLYGPFLWMGFNVIFIYFNVAMTQWLRCWILNQGSHVQNHWVAPRLSQPFILPKSIKWIPRISGNLLVKSKLPPQSGSSLEAFNVEFLTIANTLRHCEH